MSSIAYDKGNILEQADKLLVDIAQYTISYEIKSKEAYQIARHVVMDSLGTAMLALRFPECTKHLGLSFPGFA